MKSVQKCTYTHGSPTTFLWHQKIAKTTYTECWRILKKFIVTMDPRGMRQIAQLIHCLEKWSLHSSEVRFLLIVMWRLVHSLPQALWGLYRGSEPGCDTGHSPPCSGGGAAPPQEVQDSWWVVVPVHYSVSSTTLTTFTIIMTTGLMQSDSQS